MKKLTTFAEWRGAQDSFACSSETDVYETWIVVPCGQHRDSDCLDESNFAVALKTLGGESDTVAVLRFGHWAVGWTEMIVSHPSHAEAVAAMVESLDGYPILDESDFSDRETVEADRVWADCYTKQDRILYIRNNRSQFEFQSFKDLMGCVRGKYFAGYASELLG